MFRQPVVVPTAQDMQYALYIRSLTETSSFRLKLHMAALLKVPLVVQCVLSKLELILT